MNELALKSIASARRQIKTDPQLAAYIVRDLPETKEAGLLDLYWAMCQGNPVASEAEWLLDELEKFLEGKDEQRTDY